MPLFLVFASVSKVGTLLMSNTAVYGLIVTDGFNSLPDILTSLLQHVNGNLKGFSSKDSHPKYFKTTNFDAFHRQGAR